MERRTDQYGQFLERPLLNMDASGMQQNLQLIIRSGEYHLLAVLNLDDRLLVRAEGELNTGYFQRVLRALGLIREALISRPILHEGEAIGRLDAVWLNKNIYVYLYFIPFLALLLKVMHYYMRQTFIQHDLERQIERARHRGDRAAVHDLTPYLLVLAAVLWLTLFRRRRTT